MAGGVFNTLDRLKGSVHAIAAEDPQTIVFGVIIGGYSLGLRDLGHHRSGTLSVVGCNLGGHSLQAIVERSENLDYRFGFQ